MDTVVVDSGTHAGIQVPVAVGRSIAVHNMQPTSWRQVKVSRFGRTERCEQSLRNRTFASQPRSPWPYYISGYAGYSVD